MTGLIGAVVAVAVLLGIVVVLAVRPPVRRVARALADLHSDVAVKRSRLRALRPRRPPAGPSPAAVAEGTSLIGGGGRHRRILDQP